MALSTQQYSWAKNLPPAPPGSDLPIDVDYVVEQNVDLQKKLQERNNLEVDLQSQNNVLKENLKTEMEDKMLWQQKCEDCLNRIDELKSVSTFTFDKLNNELQLLRSENDLLKQKEQQERFNEFLYPVLVQSIISYRAGLIGEAKMKRTLDGTLRWMQQRVNVINYLYERKMFPEYRTKLSEMLNIDSESLIQLVKKLTV